MKNCKECQKQFWGRTDKIFCSGKCKSRFHYKLEERIKRLTLSVDKILHKNYAILQEMMYGNNTMVKVAYLRLAKKKFNFNYITNYRVNKQGKTFHYVYDLAWMTFSDNEVLIIREGTRAG